MRACIWPHLASFGPVGPFGQVWPYKALFGHFWPRLTPFGPVWPRLTPLGPVWPCFAPFVTIWPCLAPLGPDWPLFNHHLKVLYVFFDQIFFPGPEKSPSNTKMIKYKPCSKVCFMCKIWSSALPKFGLKSGELGSVISRSSTFSSSLIFETKGENYSKPKKHNFYHLVQSRGT